MINDYGYGIEFDLNCNDTLVYDNNIFGNSRGINLQNGLLMSDSWNAPISQGSRNMIFHNNFFNNSENANVEHKYPNKVTGLVNGTAIVSWDNGTVGNYWSDYQLKYPNATEIDASGIGNMPYVIDKNNIDYYPLMQRVNIAAEEPITPTPSLGTPISTFEIIAIVGLLIVITSVLIAIVIRQKNRG